MEFLSNTYFAFFLIVALGFILGNIKIKGISLDISAVIFVALIFGHYGIMIPKDFQYIGLVLFIFTVGIQAGPGFFDSFKAKGKQILIVATVIVIAGALSTVGVSYIFGIDPNIAIGMFTGALTSSPGLAAAIDTTNSPLASIGYGIAYPFGVLGVILFVRFLPNMVRSNVKDAEKVIAREHRADHPEIIFKQFEVQNDNVIGKAIGEMKVRAMTGASISRVRHNDVTFTPNPSTILNRGDVIRAVGTNSSLDKIEVLIGRETDKDVTLSSKYEVQSILVTNKEIVNKTIRQLNLMTTFNALITRIRRSGIDITPHSGSYIKFGDKLMVSCDKGNMKQVVSLLGNDSRRLSDTDLFPVAAGIILGVLVGKMNIQFTDGFSFSPGLTGGVLAVALILSNIGKTGPIIWTMTGSANQLLRQLGLLFFLAPVGTNAGAQLVSTYNQYGIKLFVIGALITILPMIIGAIVGKLVYKINILTLMGTITGGMTSTPGLAAADTMTTTDAPSVAYATVYPIAMVLLILVVQIISIIL
ncbi:MAG: transporter [Bacteroidales bacterium]|jgi:putative transport protein|nr:transporter [Bacteroidales bacterium]